MSVFKRGFIFCLFFSAAGMGGCKKLVDVGAPSSSIITSAVFSNDATAITAQLSAYAKLMSYVFYFDQYTGLSSDELTNYNTSQVSIDIYRNTLNAPTDGGLNGLWSVWYNIIYQENSILENVPLSTGMSTRVKQLMMGEAYFNRAYWYFQMVNLFGNVPLVTSTNYLINSTIPSTAAAQVYRQVVTDLQAAQGLLSSSYLDASDNTGATDRVRPTTWAADALLARVYLYMGKYDSAAQQASLVINNSSMYSLVTDLTKVFKMNSQEAIWQLTPPNGTLYTYDGQWFILIAPPGGSSISNSAAISPQLLAAFEPNDLRMANWVNSYSQGGTTWYFPYKYRSTNVTATSLSEYYMVLRLGEQYLIRAEAKAQQHDLTGAAADLNTIRQRAGLPPTTATTQADLLTAIMHEGQVELFTEEHRWFDLKRTKTVDSVMNIVIPQKGGGTWNTNQQVYPLSSNDLLLNPNLTQNPGY